MVEQLGRKHKHKFENDVDGGQWAQYTSSTPPTKSTLRAAAVDESSMVEQLPPRLPWGYQRDFPRNIPLITAFKFWCRNWLLYLLYVFKIINECTSLSSFVHAPTIGAEGIFYSSLQVRYLSHDDLCHHSWVTRKDYSIILSAIIVHQVSVSKNVKIVWNAFLLISNYFHQVSQLPCTSGYYILHANSCTQCKWQFSQSVLRWFWNWILLPYKNVTSQVTHKDTNKEQVCTRYSSSTLENDNAKTCKIF